MARGTLQQIEKVHPTLKGPDGGVPLGITTPDGKPLWKVVRKRSRSVPELDKNGEQVWKKHATTGEQILKKRKPEFYDEVLIGYEESEGNGNAIFVQWSPPTAEEIKAKERADKIAALGGGRLAELMVDRGVSPEALMDSLAGVKAEAKQETPNASGGEKKAAEAETVEYPHMYAPGRWRMSNGTTLRGKREEAEAAEAALPKLEPVEPTLPVMPEF